jgi:PAS domain S-box-containing protein
VQAGPHNANNLGERVKSALRGLRSHSPAETVFRARYFELLSFTSTLYDQAPIAYLTFTPDGKIVEANLTAAGLLAMRRELLLHQSILHFIVAEEQDRFRSYCRQLQAAQQPQRCEVRMVRADGSYFFAQIDGTLVVDLLGAVNRTGATNARQYLRATISDITDRIQLEEEERKVRRQLETTLLELQQTQEQMVKQERLAVVGQLAAGVAHDFNNIMAAITLYAQLVMNSPDLPAHLYKRMKVIVEQSGRSTQLVQQILDFSRRTMLTRQSTALGPYLHQFVELLEHTLPETIRVSLDTGSIETQVDDFAAIDPARIQQVLLNLAFNARDAMPDGGELRFTLSLLVTGETLPALASGSLAPGSWLRIAVSDSGSGIDPKDLPHLFEPFFTTKMVGSGSGLGLAQVWGIVKQHDGEIDVESRLGEGTTFSIYLPALSSVTSTALVGEAEAMPTGSGEKLLVVEDNIALRTVLSSTLEQLGYQVVVANHGQEAAALIAAAGDSIKLIVSDLVMPYMSGEELIRTLRSRGWKQPIVVLSGYPLPADKVEYLHSFGRINWLLKPPTLEQLATMVHQSLHPQLA